jgi:hypothetical protein
MAEKVGVFVSHHHSSEEDAFTDRLVADLQAAGADVWVDKAGITSDDFVKKISEGLADRQWLVLVATPASLASPWVQREVNVALNEQTAGRMLGVIPVVMQPCREQDFPMLWRTLQRYDATRDYQRAVAALCAALGLASTGATGAESRPETTPTPPTSPNVTAPAATITRTRIVDAKGKGQQRYLSAAIMNALPGEQIALLPGVYPVDVSIDKPLTFVGQGNRDTIVIEIHGNRLFSDASLVRIRAGGVRFANLTFRATERPTLIVETGGEVYAEDCTFTGPKKSDKEGWRDVGVEVHGVVSLRRCIITDCEADGVWIQSGKGTPRSILEQCLIIGCKGHGLSVLHGAVVARRNRIVNNSGAGIVVGEDGGGVFEDNDLRGNQNGAWSINNSSLPNVQRSNNLE